MSDSVFVSYAADGKTLTGIYSTAQTFPTTEVAADDPSVLAFNAPNPVPQSCTPRQARLALLAAGLLDQAEAAVTTAGGATKISWDYASVFNRTDALVTAIGGSLNLTSDQIDVLFKYAVTQ